MTGHHVLAPLVDGPRLRADDRDVPARTRADQPLVPPAQRRAPVHGRSRRHPRQPGHVGQLEQVPVGQRMTRGQHEHPWLLLDDLQRDPRGVHRRPDQRHVGPVVEQPRRRRGQVIRHEFRLHRRIRGGERGQQPGPHGPGRRHARPDPEPPGNRGRRVQRRGHPALQPVQRGPRGIQERRAGRGQHHAPAGPPQQHRPDRLFQLPDLGGQHLLRDVHAPRASAEARLLGDRDEVPQMPQFDVHRERNPNRHTITATVDTIAPREA